MVKNYCTNYLACLLLCFCAHAHAFASGEPVKKVITNNRNVDELPGLSRGLEALVAPGLSVNYIRETDIELGIHNRNEEGGIIELYRSGTIDGSYLEVQTTSSGDDSFLEEGLNVRTRYFYKCRLVGEGESPFSEPLSVTTLSMNYWPTVTANLVNNNAGVEITLTDNSFNDRQYIIEDISDARAFETSLTMPDSGQTLTVTHQHVSPGHTYRYIVSVLSLDSPPFQYYEGVTLNEISVPAAQALETPEIFDLRVDQNNITVEVLNYNEGSTTEVYRSRSPDSGYEFVGTIPAGEYLYPDEDLNVRTTYFYKIRAAKDGAFSSFSSPFETTTFSINYWPTLTAEVVDGNRIELTFTDNSANDTGYEINESAHNFHEGFSMLDSGRTVTFEIQPIVPGDTYTFELIMYTTGYPDEGFYFDENFAEVTVPGCEGTGKIRQEFWMNVSGTDISTVPFDSPPNNFKDYNSFETQQYYANSYGSRMRAYVCAPLTGDYTFWISSDDKSQLYLSTDDQPENKQLIASVTGHTAFRQYDKYSTQTSSLIHLEAGRRYYVEVLHKEGNGNDFISVGWQLPGGQLERPIPGNRLIFIEGATLNQKPLVNITSPADGATLPSGNDVTITAEASDADGTITKVEFFLVNQKIGEDLTAPYQVVWNDPWDGETPIMAIATDNSNAEAQHIIFVTIGGACEGTGTIMREIWTGIPGTSISSVPFHSPPDYTTSLTMFGTPNYTDNAYGSRIRGYVCVPESGAYTFYIASDDNSELWLSTNEDPGTKVRIASLNGAVKPGVYTKYASQVSAPVRLVGGRKYYIEALHKEGNGADHLSVAWRYPNGAFEGPIPGSRLIPYGEDPSARMASGGKDDATPLIVSDESSSEIKIFPNPTVNREVTIEIPGGSLSGEMVIQVVSPNGKVVFEERLLSQDDVSGIPIRMGAHVNAGIYFVNVLSGRKRWYGKLMIN